MGLRLGDLNVVLLTNAQVLLQRGGCRGRKNCLARDTSGATNSRHNLLETNMTEVGRKAGEMHLAKLWMLGLKVGFEKRRLVVVENHWAQLALEAKLAIGAVADLLKELVIACFGILLLDRHTCME
jgi:hypothetical protein